MEFTNVNEKLPEKGSYLVCFAIECLGIETSFVDLILYAEGYFNPQTGWKIANRFVYDCRYEQPYVSNNLRVISWMPLPSPPKD